MRVPSGFSFGGQADDGHMAAIVCQLGGSGPERTTRPLLSLPGILV